MRSIIIPFPDEHFERKKQAPLSLLMIDTLVAACAKQKEKIIFGPSDIKGSFLALVTRGYIIRVNVMINHHTETLWQVTQEAVELLKGLGITVSC